VTLNLGAEYAFRLGDDAELTPRINPSARAFTHIAYSLVRPHRQLRRGLGIADAAQGAWQVTAYGTNLSDENTSWPGFRIAQWSHSESAAARF
jgi:hypothetical protein